MDTSDEHTSELSSTNGDLRQKDKSDDLESGSAIDALISTNKALHSVIIELQSMLRDPSRFATNPVPQVYKSLEDGGQSFKEPLVQVQELFDTPIPSSLSRSGSGSEISFLHVDFDLENEKARRRHDERRTNEMKWLKTETSYKFVSFPPTSYQDELKIYNKTTQYVAKDPHQWWDRLHHPHRRGKNVKLGQQIQMVIRPHLREEILDALFNFDSTWPEHLPHTLPLRELEHTYGYKMHRVKMDLVGLSAPTNELIVAVDRFFKNLAMEEIDGPGRTFSIDHVKIQFTFRQLFKFCRKGGVFNANELQETSLARIWRVIWAFNHVAVLPLELPEAATHPPDQPGVYKSFYDDFILDVMDQHYVQDGTPISKPPLEPSSQADKREFMPKDLGFKALTELGGLKIKWTNLYSQHLLLVPSSKDLLVFWDVSILGQSPLFTHWPLWMFREHNHASATTPISQYRTKSVTLLKELQRSYRILFGNHKGRFLEKFSRKHFGRAGDPTGIELKDLQNVTGGSTRTRVDIRRSSAREALKYYLRAPVPTDIKSLRPELDLKRHRGPGKHFNFNLPFRKKTSGKLVDLLDAPPPYPLDFWMHISYLLELSQSSSLSEMEMYSAYPIFGDRLRELKAYMDKQKPRNLKQLIKDRRDTVGYWAFWAVIVVGGLSIILTLISIAFSSAQTVAAFKALGPLYRNNATTTP